MPEPTTTTKPTSITEAVQQWKARMAETLARTNQLDDAIAALIQERDEAIAQRREPDKKISDALTAARLDLGGISLLMDGASIPQGIEAYRGGDDGDSETQARVRILIRERNEARGSERILSQLLGEAAKRLGLNPTSFEPPHVLQMIDRWRMDLDQMAQVEALLRANTSGRIYAAGPGAPTLLGIAREAVEDIKAGQSWRRDSEALQKKASALEDQLSNAMGLLGPHAPTGALDQKIHHVLHELAEGHTAKADLERITGCVADCHTVLTARGGPMKPLPQRIDDVLNDRDNCQRQQATIQAELDTARTLLRETYEALENPKHGAVQCVEAAQRILSRDPANWRVSITDERARAEKAEAILATATRERDTIGREWQRLLARVQAAQKLLESYIPRRGSMVEKALRALQGYDFPPDRTREPLLPICEFLWDDEPHHPSPPIEAPTRPLPEGYRLVKSAGWADVMQEPSGRLVADIMGISYTPEALEALAKLVRASAPLTPGQAQDRTDAEARRILSSAGKV